AVAHEYGVDLDAGRGGEGIEQRLDQARLAGGVEIDLAGGGVGDVGGGRLRGRGLALAAGGKQQQGRDCGGADGVEWAHGGNSWRWGPGGAGPHPEMRIVLIRFRAGSRSGATPGPAGGSGGEGPAQQ